MTEIERAKLIRGLRELGHWWDECNEAADEIERLQAMHVETEQEWAALQYEREVKLRAENERLLGWRDKWMETAKALQAENERLTVELKIWENEAWRSAGQVDHLTDQNERLRAEILLVSK